MSTIANSSSSPHTPISPIPPSFVCVSSSPRAEVVACSPVWTFDPIDAINVANIPGPRVVAEESLATGAKSSEVTSDGAEPVAAVRPAACCRSRRKRDIRTVVRLSQTAQHCRDSRSEEAWTYGTVTIAAMSALGRMLGMACNGCVYREGTSPDGVK